MSTEEQDPICRICLTGPNEEYNEEKNALLSPCLCKGTTRWVHQNCLKRWREGSYNMYSENRCEICTHPFIIVKLPPTFLQFVLERWSLMEWLVHISILLSAIYTTYKGYEAYLFSLSVEPHRVVGLSLLRLISKFWLYGWGAKSKLMYLSLILLFPLGDKFTFGVWKRFNCVEVVVGKQYKSSRPIKGKE